MDPALPLVTRRKGSAEPHAVKGKQPLQHTAVGGKYEADAQRNGAAAEVAQTVRDSFPVPYDLAEESRATRVGFIPPFCAFSIPSDGTGGHHPGGQTHGAALIPQQFHGSDAARSDGSPRIGRPALGHRGTREVHDTTYVFQCGFIQMAIFW